ncbi:YutD-like domain-containing protein [Gorillibacterium timonense]|uniref:YutD-like domain-containing protein n=1 Tax=Gorillibacterium timonense TaxID=1689269 RepID=UPI001F375ECC|nr:YutD-like domain-containing protein [Gorillibacterium timonense]
MSETPGIHGDGGANLFHVGGNVYELVKENKSGWNLEMFRNRYSEVLERYDYVVGDWGYNQLRLRGFFKEANPRMTKESSIVNLEDYINEYCNFGCAYFVLEKVGQSDRTSEEAAILEEGGQVEGAAASNEAGRPDKLERPDRYNRSGEPRPVRPVRPDSRPVRERGPETRSAGGSASSEREPSRPGGERVQWPDKKSPRPDGDRSSRPRQDRNSDRQQERPNRQPDRPSRNSEHSGPRPDRTDKQQERMTRHADRPERSEQQPQSEHHVRNDRPDKRHHRKPNADKPRNEQAVAETSSHDRRPMPYRKRRHGGGGHQEGSGNPASSEQGSPRPPRQRPQGPNAQPPSGN